MGKSELEARFAIAWRGMGDPMYEVAQEYRFDPHRQWRFDFAFPDQRLAVEIDGGQWAPHGGRHARDTDREKLNRAAVLGWRVLRYSGTMLRAPQTVIDEVLDALDV